MQFFTPYHCSTVACCPEAFGNVPSWLTCFKHDDEAAPSGVARQPCQLSNPSLLPGSEAIKSQSPLGADGLIWEMEGALLSISF